MKTTPLLKPILWLLVFASGLSCAAAAAPTYERGDQLLAGVNTRMKEMGRPAFTLNELTVWLARQADTSRLDGQLQPRVRRFLECLARRKKFKDPVGLRTVMSNDLNLSDSVHSPERLHLPAHSTLEVAIYNAPPGSRDNRGQPLKITWSSITVATALGSPAEKKGQ